jgi:hypothetical protein
MACAERFAAAIRITRFLLGHTDPQTHAKGHMLLCNTVIELQGRIDDGLAGRLDDSKRLELGELLRGIDEKSLATPIGGSRAGQALEACRGAFATPAGR